MSQTTNQNPEPNEIPGKSQATTSMVLGIISVACWFLGLGAIISVVTGIIGLIMANKSKVAGFEGGNRTAGFVLSLIGLIGGAIVLIACVACVGTGAAIGSSGAVQDLFDDLLNQ